MSRESLDLRLVRYFVTVAHTRHFTRAAEQLFITQPALSQAISKLERLLDAQLLVRDSRSVVLTSLGERFLEKAEEILKATDEALHVVMQARAERHRLLRVGFIPGVGAKMTLILEKTEQLVPGLTIQTRRLDWIRQESAVVEGDVEVGFARRPLAAPELDSMTIESEPRYLCVNQRHRLSNRRSVSITEIAGEPVVTSSTCPSVEWRDYWAVVPRPDNSEVRWGPAVDSLEEMLDVVSRGRGVCITAASVAYGYQHTAVSFIPVIDVSESSVAMCWRRDNDSHLVHSIRKAAQAVISTDRPANKSP